MVLFWPKFYIHLPRCSFSVFLETTDVLKTARRVHVLAANDIHMDPVGQTRIPNNGRPRTAAAGATAAAAATREYDDDVSKKNLMKPLLHVRRPVVVPSAAVGLGFHSGFLDDDELSAALSPKYRDEPDSARTVRAPRSGGDESS